MREEIFCKKNNGKATFSFRNQQSTGSAKRCSKVISKVISKRFWWFVSDWKNTNFMENLLYFFFLVSQVTVDYKYHVLLGVEIKNKNVL